MAECILRPTCDQLATNLQPTCTDEKRTLEIGGTIQCTDADDMIGTMKELAKSGVNTEFLYERDGQKGLWLVVTDLEVKNE